MTNAGKDDANICKLVKVEAENHDIYTIYLDGADKKFTRRKAGQFASISIRNNDGWSEPHPFTISGAPEDKLLALTVKKVGAFTTALKNLPPGSPLKCQGPVGNFCIDIDNRKIIILIGGGVGISPFLSVLRHFRNIRSGNKITLFWINKSHEDVFAENEINDLTQTLDLAVINCLSREDNLQSYLLAQYPNVFYEKGRLSLDILQRYGVKNDAAFYLCGPPPMMDAALVELDQLNIDKSAVAQERFSWQKK